ncbi:McrC family protein [Vreelandella zhanjiangensis]|uniref:McrC family protein n=1 Tax=Vreelandella zhanjiangensis TaxID=1121960 RepID=UPI00036CFBDA|nr:McrC family protein [Halomonas zhanjiangensis]
MNKRLITIREYARLTTETVTSSLDLAQVPSSAFDWLCDVSSNFSRRGAQLLQIEGHRSLIWDSYVGVLETPCGIILEILPKHFEHEDCVQQSRALLRRMIQSALYLKPRQVSVTGLELFEAPLSEWVMSQYLSELDRLVKRGLRFDYRRVEEEQRFLRGQLNVAAQIRQPPGRQHNFQIRHDIFSPNRPENRLLKLALERVSKATRDSNNWRLATELRARLQDVPRSIQVELDLKAWRRDRLMSYYQAVKPWCEVILNQEMPLAVTGEWQGISLLFPMEKLFEKYVENWLRNRLGDGCQIKSQASSFSLCKHNEEDIFCLKPDILLERGGQRWILDAKWKRLNQSDRKKNYNLDQGDFYQLYAYGQKYMDGKGKLALIYPKHRNFSYPLEPFDFDESLQLWALPFDLEKDQLVGVSLPLLPLL